MIKKISLISSIILISNISYGHNHKPNKLLNCPATKTHSNNFEPKTFPKINNLLRKTGEIPYQCKNKLLIKGTVKDLNCVPLQDVTVKMWQVNESGKYPYKFLRRVASEKDSDLTGKTNFTGAGTTITDNKGHFYFITCYPSKFKGTKPHVDFRVYHNLPKSSDYRYFTKMSYGKNVGAHKLTPEHDIRDGFVNEVTIIVDGKTDMKEY